LDSTSTAPQLIQAVYGNQGEAGYRLGFIFDSERRFDPAFADIQEVPNLYTTNDSTLAEGFDISVQGILATELQTSVDSSELSFQTSTVEQSDAITGPFNFNSTFEKVQPFTRDSLSARTDTTLVFTVVEVRNDQDINLFVGTDSNGFNAVSQTLEAEIETVGLPPTVPEFGFVENVVPEITLPARDPDQTTIVDTVELPQVTTFQRQGTLSWIAVKIDDPNTEEDDENPELNITEIDGELILNDPLIDYQPLDPDETPKTLDGLKRNQYEQITATIEADPEAEVGLWYKVYIENDEDSGKENELLFYYYKTGEKQDIDAELDADVSAESVSKQLPIGSSEAEELPELRTITLDDGSSDEHSRFGKVVSSPLATRSVGVIDGSLDNEQAQPVGSALLGAVLLTSLVTGARNGSSSQEVSNDEPETEPSPDFENLNRLKQQFKDLLC